MENPQPFWQPMPVLDHSHHGKKFFLPVQSCSLQPYPKWFLLWNLVQETLKHLYYLWIACWTAGQWIRLSCLAPVIVLCDWLVSIYTVLSNITGIRKPQDVMNHTLRPLGCFVYFLSDKEASFFIWPLLILRGLTGFAMDVCVIKGILCIFAL